MAVVCIGEHIETSILTTLHLVSLGVPQGGSQGHQRGARGNPGEAGRGGSIPGEGYGPSVWPTVWRPPEFWTTSSSAKKINISKLQIPEKLIGKSVVDMDLRGRFGLNIIAVEKQRGSTGTCEAGLRIPEKRMCFWSPAAGTVLPGCQSGWRSTARAAVPAVPPRCRRRPCRLRRHRCCSCQSGGGEGKLCRTLPGGGLPGEYRASSLPPPMVPAKRPSE